MEESLRYDTVEVRITRTVAQALWAAMHEDDDLAEDYIEVCIVHGLNHLVQDVGPDPYSRDEWEKLRKNLQEARKQLELIEDGMVKRWNTYNEPPF